MSERLKTVLVCAGYLAVGAFVGAYAWNLLTPPSWRFWGPETMAALKWPFVAAMVWGLSDVIEGFSEKKKEGRR